MCNDRTTIRTRNGGDNRFDSRTNFSETAKEKHAIQEAPQ